MSVATTTAVPASVSSFRRLSRQARIDQGYATMRAVTVTICGLARNVAQVLPQTLARIESLGQCFDDYQVVIYENDSTDATRAILRAWQQQNRRAHLILEDRGDPVNPPTSCLQRAARMARYRNELQDYVGTMCRSTDYVIVVDTDLLGGWSREGIAHTFGNLAWDCVGSYGIIWRRDGWNPNVPIHYDVWAYRPWGSYVPVSHAVGNQLRWSLDDDQVPVYSCFGGLGVYRSEAWLNGRYSGGDCEHVGLHRSMRQAGYDRQFLNPQQLTFYGRKRRKSDLWARPCLALLDWIQGTNHRWNPV